MTHCAAVADFVKKEEMLKFVGDVGFEEVFPPTRPGVCGLNEVDEDADV